MQIIIQKNYNTNKVHKDMIQIKRINSLQNETISSFQNPKTEHTAHCALCAVLYIYNSAQQYKYITGLHDKKQK